VVLAGLAVIAALTAVGGYADTAYTVETATIAVGGKQMKVLTDPKGMTLYYFASDTAMQSACTGGCASAWPPLLSTTAPTSEDPLPGKLTLVKTANGSQVAYNGHLLYRYAADKAGQANGQGMGGKWWAASVDLKATSMSANPTTSNTNSSKSGDGW
jgi:predicted lipoprotein with Yx(FWY)xxD motif